jgi:hypothetical protein
MEELASANGGLGRSKHLPQAEIGDVRVGVGLHHNGLRGARRLAAAVEVLKRLLPLRRHIADINAMAVGVARELAGDEHNLAEPLAVTAREYDGCPADPRTFMPPDWCRSTSMGVLSPVF